MFSALNLCTAFRGTEVVEQEKIKKRKTVDRNLTLDRMVFFSDTFDTYLILKNPIS